LILEPASEGKRRRKRKIDEYDGEKREEGKGRRTLRTTSRHDQRRVVPTKLLHTNLSNLITNLWQISRDLTLERLFGVWTGKTLKLALGGLTDVGVGFAVSDGDEVVLFSAELDTGSDVRDTDRETLVGCGWRGGREKGGGGGRARRRVWRTKRRRERKVSSRRKNEEWEEENAPSHLAHNLAIRFIQAAASSAPKSLWITA
jgi:hypothetical protein